MNRRKRGERAEEIVASYLESIGYEILDRNVHMRVGEIDIVAMHDGELVFVEVRSSSSSDPIESITRRKMEHLSRAILMYMAERSLDLPFRIEIITVVGGKVHAHIRDIMMD